VKYPKSLESSGHTVKHDTVHVGPMYGSLAIDDRVAVKYELFISTEHFM